MSILSRKFWTGAVERAVKTASQFALVFVGADAVNILEVDLMTAAGFAGAGALVSILTSLASGPFAEHDSASMVKQ